MKGEWLFNEEIGEWVRSEDVVRYVQHVLEGEAQRIAAKTLWRQWLGCMQR